MQHNIALGHAFGMTPERTEDWQKEKKKRTKRNRFSLPWYGKRHAEHNKIHSRCLCLLYVSVDCNEENKMDILATFRPRWQHKRMSSNSTSPFPNEFPVHI